MPWTRISRQSANWTSRLPPELLQVRVHLDAHLVTAPGRPRRWCPRAVTNDRAIEGVSKSASPSGEFGGPKTKAGVRDVPLSPLLRKLLVAWRVEAHRSGDGDLVIGTRAGKPVAETTVRQALRAAAKEAGLEGEERLSPHSLRHGYASRLGLGGLNPVTLARIIGHTNAAFTMRTYCADQRSVEDVAVDVLRASAV